MEENRTSNEGTNPISMPVEEGTNPTPMSVEEGTNPISMSVEEVIESSLGKMTWLQFLQAILACVPLVFDNQQALISTFTDRQPAWHCTEHNIRACNALSNICSLPRADWNWVGNKQSTIISDWDLQCASSFMKGLPTTSHFLGCLLSGFVLASLADSSLGRKNLMVISCLTMSLAALASGFSPGFWWYCVFRFVCGVGRVSIAVTSIVLLSERVGTKWRGQIALLAFIALTIGLLSLTGIAYLTRNLPWRALYICTSVPGIVFSVLLHFCLFESPRWMFLHGRQNDALSVLKRLGSIDHLSSLMARNMLKIEQSRLPNANPFSSVKVLFGKRWSVQRLIASMVLNFGVGMMYYGMFLGVGGIGPNIYLNSILNAVIFLLASLLTFLFWIQKCNRRSSVLAFCTISGAASIISTIAGKHYKGVRVGLELTALFCACMCFNIVFMYTVELFPTCVRSTASSLTRQALTFSSIFVPVLVVVGGRNELFSHTVFGVSIFVGGMMVLTLPETRGKVLCDTMEEQETTLKEDGSFCGCI